VNRQTRRILARAGRVLAPANGVLGPDRFGDAFAVLVEDGLVASATGAESGRRRVIFALAGADSVLPPPRAGEVLLALEDATLVPLAREQTLRAPALAELVACGLAEAVAGRDETLALFGIVSHVERVRERLRQLAREHGRVGRDGIVLDLVLTHELMAAMVGSARETVTAAFGELEREGFLSRDGRRYRVNLSPESLPC
jgi:Crp-like helix-turn-helix domain